LQDEVYQIIGCARDVLNTLGPGLLEKPDENARVVEFGLWNIPVSQQYRFAVLYKTVKVGDYFPDLIAVEKVIVETKAIEKVTHLERGQVINYLKLSRLPVCDT